MSPHIERTTCGPFARKLACAAALALAVLCLLGGASREAAAQRVQDGPKLVGSGVFGPIADQGTSVAVSADGNTAIVGGPFDNGANGAAWVFIQNNGAWTQQQKLVASNGAGSDQGLSVALSADGNTAIVGGPIANGVNGAAWVYTRTNGVWTEQQMLAGSGVIGSRAFQGSSVALSGDGNTAIVGGPTDNTDPNTNHAIGAAWVFTQSNGVWTQQQKLVGSGVIGGNAAQGTSVALSANGSTAIVGGPADNTTPNSNIAIGAAWVFTQSNGSWTEQQELVGSESLGSNQGTSVALSADGSTAMMGGPSVYPDGAAWVFSQSNGSWSEQQRLVGSGVTDSNGSQARQGTSVALSANGSTAIVGGPGDNFNGTSGSIGAAWAFSIPAVTAIAPSGGPAAGGTAVTITGSNFTYATAVHFGANFAPSFTVNSAGSIATIAPAGSGTVDVTVTVDGVTTATSAADRFSYQVPAVTMIAPSSGPAAGGTSVTITGANFSGASDVQFGAAYAPAFTVNSATSITATAPAGSGTVDVTVTVDGFTSATSAADQFSYGAGPAVTSVAPNSGSAAGGTAVTITGAGFTGATAVSFGGNAATSFNVVSATSITATSPAGSGTVDVTVTTSAGTSATGAADGFTYIAVMPQPAVTAISPNTGVPSGGTTVTITGANFTGVTAVRFGGNTATSVTVNSVTKITATSPAGTGTVDVTVTAAGGASAASSADQFSYGFARTWVSGTGDDTSQCVVDAPCQTFAAAMALTLPGGEIDALDPGDFGPVTITKSLSIVGNQDNVSALSPTSGGTSGIVVAAGANDVVNLRGLIFDGLAGTGASGVVFNSGAKLRIKGCTFLGFAGGGITFSPGAGSAAIAKMVVEKSNILGSGSGVVISPSAGIVANVILTHTRTDGNSGDGVIADGTAGGGAISVAIANASIGFNAGNGVNAVSGSGSVTIDIIRSAIETNGLAGILSNQSGGGSANVTVGSSQIHGNGVGMQSAGGGSLRTYSNNQVTGNQTTGSFTGPVGLQ